jgi:hypothetical protein
MCDSSFPLLREHSLLLIVKIAPEPRDRLRISGENRKTISRISSHPPISPIREIYAIAYNFGTIQLTPAGTKFLPCGLLVPRDLARFGEINDLRFLLT